MKRAFPAPLGAVSEANVSRADKLQSIKKRQDFKRVYSQGKYAADSLFVAYALANDLTHNRLGVTVSKKANKSAVVRNRVRRWVKESLRLRFKESGSRPICYDLVVVARAKATELDRKAGAFFTVNESIDSLLGRINKKAGFLL